MYDISATDAQSEDVAQPSRKRTNDGTKRPASHVKMFPGAIVCSLLRKDLGTLVDQQRNNYVALEKTDGVRYLLLLTTVHQVPYAILIDRKMQLRIVNLDLPRRVYEQEVLFDGELAQNVENGLFTFLIFDLIYTGVPNDTNEPLRRDTPYTHRMRHATLLIRDHWHKNLTTEAEYNAYNRTPTSSVTTNSRPPNTFSIKVKRYVQLSEFENTFGEVCYRNNWTYHGFRIDGFIFVRTRQGVEPFRNLRQFKYKPADKHTIDVQLIRAASSPATTAMQQYDLLAKNARNCPEKYASLDFCPHNVAFLYRHRDEIDRCHREFVNFIVECSWDSTLLCWLLQQPRLDKQVPNAVHTIEQTKRNIDENITVAELMQTFRPLVRHLAPQVMSSPVEMPPTIPQTPMPMTPMTPMPLPLVSASLPTPQRSFASASQPTAQRPFGSASQPPTQQPTLHPTAPGLQKGAFIHPSRLRNFAPIPAAQHPVPWLFGETVDDGCECDYCKKKRQGDAYDPEENWHVESGAEAEAAKEKEEEKEEAKEGKDADEGKHVEATPTVTVATTETVPTSEAAKAAKTAVAQFSDAELDLLLSQMRNSTAVDALRKIVK
jgi:hypothetical protein